MSAKSHLSSQNHHVCTWWIAYTFDNPLRKLFHNPQKIFGGYIKEGMTVVDVGCGMGYFSIGLAKLVGATGKVIAVDLQQKMLDIMQKRARRAGVGEIIMPHHCEANKLGLGGPVDFILAFWMVHEVADKDNFLGQLRSILAPDGKILIAEPRMHVGAEELDQTIAMARNKGFQCREAPGIRFSRTALLQNDVSS
ncbi:Methyltransferase type 11 [Olavius algarvensis Delta 1 endosymbiont]|nr:Methyltransferase type 11 [Olavius algarvensis Delta 1 endosymbiont]